jgi:hypothetical protein
MYARNSDYLERGMSIDIEIHIDIGDGYIDIE